MIVVGVDPGKTGAIAALDGFAGELIEVYDMPVVGKQKGVNVHMLADIVQHLTSAQSATFVIEDVTSSPQMGVVSAFSFGRSKGIVEAAAAMTANRIVYVTPSKWKREMRLGKDKGEARARAIERWPRHLEKFKRVKDDGRAEAALIGLWQVNHGEA